MTNTPSKETTSRDNPYLKRAILYLPISLMAVVYGIIHASRVMGVFISSNQYGGIVLLLSPVLIDMFLFLVFYTQLFRGSEILPDPPIKAGTINAIGYVSCIQMAILVATAYWYNLSYAIVLACYSTITLISCVLMKKKAASFVGKENVLREQKVRLELIWPSIYIVALGIVCGFFLIASRTSPTDSSTIIPIVVPMFFVTLYSIAMFMVEDFKRDGKEAIHPIHWLSLLLLFGLTIFRNSIWFLSSHGTMIFPFKHFGLFSWAIIISSIYALLEAWAVVERRHDDKAAIVRYIKSANIILVAHLFLLPIFYVFTLSANISPAYILGYAFFGILYFMIRYLKRRGEKNANENYVRSVKIIMTLICTVILVVCELFSVKITNQIETFFIDQVPLAIGTLSTLISAISITIIISKSTKKTKADEKKKQNLIFIFKSYEDTNNLVLQVIYSSAFGALVFGILTLVGKSFTDEAHLVFPYTLSATCFCYVLILLICLIVKGIEWIKSINTVDSFECEPIPSKEDSESFIKSSIEEQKISISTRLQKISELLHVPSSSMIFLLIFIPSTINGLSTLMAVLRALPLTLIAMAGFALNNYIDADKDIINKPKRAIPSGIISRWIALQLCTILYMVAIIILVSVKRDFTELAVSFCAIIGTLVYSLFSKKLGYVKTLITGILTTAPFIIVMHYYQPSVNIILFLTAIVLSTIGKELLMDVNDIKGDDYVGQQTIATRLGSTRTQILSFSISVLAILLYLLSYKLEPTSIMLIAISSIFVLSCSYIIWFAKRSKHREFGIYLLWGVMVVCGLPVLV
jgi:4-hydroxybenzoate polyprenyltransferase